MEIEIENLGIEGLDNVPQVTENKPETPQANKKQWNNNGNKQWNKQPQVNLWDDTNIDPVKFEFLKMDNSSPIKTFTIAYNIRATEPIPEDKIKALRLCTKILLDKGFRCRSWLGVDAVAQEISKEFEAKPTMIDYFMLTRKHNPAIQAPISFTNKKMGFQLAKGFIKVYEKVPNIVRAITARDIEVCLGGDFNQPLKCIILYAKGGHERLNKEYETMRNDGNLPNLMKMASDLQIPVFNVDTSSFAERFKTFVETGKYISHYQYESKKGKNDHKLVIDKPEVIAGIEETNSSVVDGITKDEVKVGENIQPVPSTTETKPVETVVVKEPDIVTVANETVPAPESTNTPVTPNEAKQELPGDVSNLEDLGIVL